MNKKAYKRKKINRARPADYIMAVFISILCLTCILPFIHLAAKSISGNSAVMAKEVLFIPKDITFEAYKAVFGDKSLMHSLVYSVLVTVIFTVLGMIVCTCAAYPLAKKRLKGRRILTFILIVPMYFNAGLIPTYLLYSKLNLIDSMWVLILPLIYSAYNMVIMKSYFQTPEFESLEEAAKIDGSSDISTLFRVILPLSKPIIATLSLFYAVGRWNAYADNMYFIRKKNNLKMIQYLLYRMVASATESQTTALSEAGSVTSTPEVLQAAAVMFVTIPIIIVYPFLQKYFSKGAFTGAIKA